MTPEKAQELLEKFNAVGSSAPNFFAQANARYILFNVNEPVENINKIDFRPNLNEGLDSLAFSFISIGCCFAENSQYENSIKPLERGAEMIEYNHLPMQNRREHSKYYLLISSLAYYASNQYSKAFILLKDVETETSITKLVGYFLKKDFTRLTLLINEILLGIEIEDDDQELENKVNTILLTKSFANLLEYIHSGNQTWLENAKEILKDLFELSVIEGEALLFWIVRLLKIILNGFEYNSLWSNISPLATNEAEVDIVMRFISSYLFRKKSIIELFTSQRKAIAKAINPEGAVICLPTSSGKTRVAEITILETLLKSPGCIILYLAPFKSLAFEVENTLNLTFEPLGYEVSHLYGGSQFSKIDKTLIGNSNIVIATPEKAKAILRADHELKERIKLIVIDEGHLLDESKRYVTNEIFVEELKYYISQNSGKILLLSAVLPNSDEISEWITQSKDQIVKSDWRPSSQRLGILSIKGNNVTLEWQGEEKSFNNRFVETFEVGRRKKLFPRDKKEAVAGTAVRLAEIGAVLVFVGRATMVDSYAKAIKTAFRGNLQEVEWPNEYDWKAFELACLEAFGENSSILEYAKFGIICHNGKLPGDVRVSLEKLMRDGKPKVIISTTTLAQGVNIGVSSVIVANIWITNKPIDKKDFWNIAGRAGRAFVDSEGKILFAIDKNNDQWRIDRDEELAKGYFRRESMEDATSGLLLKLSEIENIAENCGVEPELLHQLIAENDFSSLVTENGDDKSQIVEDFFDWIDDTLLTLNILFEDFDSESESEWIDDHFRNSLAYIQAKYSDEYKEEGVISYLKSRNQAVKRMAGDPNKWRGYSASGLPLRSILKIDERIGEILDLYITYNESGKSEEDLIEFFASMELELRNLPSSHFKSTYDESNLDEIRQAWFTGNTLREDQNSDFSKITVEYYGFSLPWVLNAISKKLNTLENEEAATFFEEMAVISELGLPNFFAAKIYLAGIKSRITSTELSNHLSEEYQEYSVKMLGEKLREEIKEDVSELTKQWLEILNARKPYLISPVERVSDFSFNEEFQISSDTLFVKRINDDLFLCSPDFEDKIPVSSTDELPFDKIANNNAIYFQRKSRRVWSMKNRSPFFSLA